MKILLPTFMFLISFSTYSQNEIPFREIQNNQLIEVVKSFDRVLDSLEREKKKNRISERYVVHKPMIGLFIHQFSISDSIPSSSEQEDGYVVQSFDLSKMETMTNMTFELSPGYYVYDFDIPTFYFFIDKRPVLVYTGFEKMWRPNARAAKKLRKKLKEFQNEGTGATAPIWVVEIVDGNTNYLFRNL